MWGVRGLPCKRTQNNGAHRGEGGGETQGLVEGLPSPRAWEVCVGEGGVGALPTSKFKSTHFHPVHISLLLSHINYAGTLEPSQVWKSRCYSGLGQNHSGLKRCRVGPAWHLSPLSHGVCLFSAIEKGPPNPDLTPS